MDPWWGAGRPRAGTRCGTRGAESYCPRLGAGCGNLPAVWSPAFGGREIPDGSFLVKLALVKSCHKGLRVLLPGPPSPLLSSPPHSKGSTLGQAGSPPTHSVRPGGGVCLSGPLGRRGHRGTDSSGFSSSLSMGSLALTPTGGHLGCKALEGGLFCPLGPL